MKSSRLRSLSTIPSALTRLVLPGLLVASSIGNLLAAADVPAPDKAEAVAAMKRATQFMVDEVSCKGGFVWSYLPDKSRCWGELEARHSMIWTQGSGTPAMGQLFLDAYHATQDEFYYLAAARAADALIAGQHPSGGWNYVIDTAGEESLREWYATYGRNAWRMEEFQHYYGNATFDDAATSSCAKFMLRLFLEKREPRFKASLDKAIRFVLDAQYPNGGWPQRFPLMGGFVKEGHPDYTGFITFNDGVADENIEFLIQCYTTLGDERLLDPIRRGMKAYQLAQQPAPQPGWALQYTPDLKPAGARTYEPEGLASHGTATCIGKMIEFYRLTGDRSYLARLPEALDWLDSLRLTNWEIPEGREGDPLPTFIELGTNQPLFLHRTGSNVTNGHYYADHDPRGVISHYGSVRYLNLADLRARVEAAAALSSDEATRGSPLFEAPGSGTLPRFVMVRSPQGPGNGRDPRDDRFARFGSPEARARRAIDSLDAKGRWLTPLFMASHPFVAQSPEIVAPGDYGSTNAGDAYDTSPYRATEKVDGISTDVYIRNMGTLIRQLVSSETP